MTTPTSPATTVWDDLVGQRPTIEVLQHAAAGVGMTHAWLFTGPPGSGRSNVARAFAAALQCETRTGCGVCEACRLGTNGTHPDITWVKSETSVLYVDDMRDLVLRAAMFPSIGRWQIVVIEDADRLHREPAHRQRSPQGDRGAHRPRRSGCCARRPCRTCSRRSAPACRTLTLATPGTRDVAAFLTRNDGISETMAASPRAPARGTSAAPARSPSTRRPAPAAARWSASRPA